MNRAFWGKGDFREGGEVERGRGTGPRHGLGSRDLGEGRRTGYGDIALHPEEVEAELRLSVNVRGGAFGTGGRTKRGKGTEGLGPDRAGLHGGLRRKGHMMDQVGR